MVRFTVRRALLVGAVLAAVVTPARADQPAPPPGGAPHAAGAGPRMKTIYVTECVPETVQCQRTVYRQETRQEKYTAYRCETTTEVRERVVTCYKVVPTVETQTRRVAVSVPTVEERTVMRPHWVTRTVTEMQTRTVDRGSYEYREVPDTGSGGLLGGLFGRGRGGHGRRGHGHGNGGGCCDDPCATTCCVPMKTVKCWKPCLVTEQCPVTRCVRTCEMRPEVCRVTVCRTEWREEKCQVTVNRCVPETRKETFTVCVPRQVAYEAVRTVCVCVPHVETYCVTRLVPRCVARLVPDNDCCEPCAPVCCDNGGGRKHGGGGFFSRFRRGGGGCCH